ncbi:MAG: AmmeMemoRadiSam system protein B, partial [Treponema sp.]|nr:AmmeMemoRadiSam system protein B [Treponema sp.]
MKVRESILPPGWYPDDPGEISRFLTNCTGENNVPRRPSAVAAVSPHAGWYYSGKTAAKAVASLNPAAETVVVIGGHLSSAMAPLFAMEDAVRTPFGPVHIDTQLRELLIHELDSYEDRYQDNTVEVLLPIVRFYLPNAGIV